MFACNLLGNGEMAYSLLAKRGIAEVVFSVDGWEEVSFYKKGNVNGTYTLHVTDKVVTGADKVDVLGTLDYKGMPYPEGSFVDTPENPIIWVLAKSINIIENTPCYIKSINIGDNHVLVALIDGVCEFENIDGEFIRLERCAKNITSVSSSKKNLKGSDLISANSLTDEKSDYRLAKDSVSALIFNLKNTPKSGVVFKCKSLRSGTVILVNENIDIAREQKRRKDELEAQKLAEKEEQRRIRAEEAQRAREEAERRAQEEQFSFGADEVAVTDESSSGISAGAMSFMQAVSKLKNA